MKIAILGQGLGYSLSNLFASLGHDVIGVDIKTSAWLKSNVDAPMREYITQHKNNIEGNVRYTLNYHDISDREIVFNFVETPLLQGRLGIESVRKATREALETIPRTCIFVMMSTLPVGGSNKLFTEFGDELKIRYVYVPPMIQKANFLKNYLSPPYLLFGYDRLATHGVISRVTSFYKSFIQNEPPIHHGSPKQMEVTKLATNAFGLMKGTFFNRLGDYCMSQGVDPMAVCEAVGSHPIIRPEYSIPGTAIGGPCLPRDIVELYNSAKDNSDFAEMLKQIERFNFDYGQGGS